MDCFINVFWFLTLMKTHSQYSKWWLFNCCSHYGDKVFEVCNIPVGCTDTNR